MKIWPGLRLGCALMNLQPDRLRAGKRDEPRLRMRNNRAAETPGPLPGRGLPHHPAARLFQQLMNFAAIVGASTEGFRITVFPQTIAAAVIPAIIAKGKFHGGITAPTPSGM